MKFKFKKKQTEEKEKGKRGKIIHSRFLFYGFLALLFGLVLARKLYAGEGIYIAITVVALASVLICLCLTKRFAMLCMIFILFFAGNGLYFWSYSSFIGKDYDGVCAITGRVCDDVVDYATYYSLTIDDVTINGEKTKNINLTISKSDDFAIKTGDVLAFESQVNHVNLYELGTFQFFYYRNKTPYHVSLNANNTEIVIVDGYIRYDEAIRAKTKTLLENNMSEDNASICYAVLFGDKSGIDGVVKDRFSMSGVIHILTVSGLHVGFLVALLSLFLKKSNKYIRFSVIFLILLLYNILCGFAPSVMRASIMALVLLISKLSGREYDNLTSLSLAGFLIVLPQPLVALDTGFLMSYFCVAGIFLLYKKLTKVLSKVIPEKVAGYIALSLSAQIGILPFLASMFSSFNFLSVFANLIILPIFSILFPVLFVLFLLGLIMPFIGALLHVIEWLLAIINYFASLFASTSLIIGLKPFPIVFNILLCLGLFVFSYFVMVKSVVRYAMLSVVVLASCITLIVDDSKSKDNNTMEYSCYAGEEFVYVINDEGESLLVCNYIDSDDFNKYAHLRNIKDIDYMVTLTNEIDLLGFKKYNIQAIAYPTLMAIGDKSFELEQEQIFEFGEYSFKFKYFASSCVGVEFSVNNFENFFACDDYLSYNTIDEMNSYLTSSHFAFNFLNKQSRIYSAETKGAKLVTYRNEHTKYSLYGMGNLQIRLNENNWALRCID